MLTEPELTDRLARAFRNHGRRRILSRLRRGEASTSDLARDLGINRANLSQHLSILRVAGLVVSERRGRFLTFALPPGPTRQAYDTLLAARSPGTEDIEEAIPAPKGQIERPTPAAPEDGGGTQDMDLPIVGKFP